MAKLADAADLKSADQKWLWGFKSPSRHQQRRDPSATLGISAAGFRCAHARKAPQLKIRRPEGLGVKSPAGTSKEEIPRLRSGFRLRAPAALTPAKRLNLKSADQKWLWGFKSPSRHQQRRDPSATLGISAAGSRCAHARKEQIPRLRSGFRLRAPAVLTPAKRLNLKSADQKWLWGFKSPSRHQQRTDPSATLGISAAGSRCAHARKAPQLKIADQKWLWGFKSPSRHQQRRDPSATRDFGCGLSLRSRPSIHKSDYWAPRTRSGGVAGYWVFIFDQTTTSQ